MSKRLPNIALFLALVHQQVVRIVEVVHKLRSGLMNCVRKNLSQSGGGKSHQSNRSSRKSSNQMPVNRFAQSWLKVQEQGSRLSISWRSRRTTHRISLTQYQLSMLAVMAGAFVAGSFFTLSEVLLPRLRALTETVLSQPTDVAFNRQIDGILAGFDDGGGQPMSSPKKSPLLPVVAG